MAQQGVLKGLQEKKPDKMEDEDREEMQLHAAATIWLCLSDQVMFHVMDLTSPKEIWDKLSTQYMSTLTTKLYLKQKLYELNMMQEGSDLVEHLNVFNQLVADLARRGNC